MSIPASYESGAQVTANKTVKYLHVGMGRYEILTV